MINSVPSVDDLSQLSADIQFSKIFKQINKDLQFPSDIKDNLIINGYNIMIEKSNNNLKTKDLNEIVKILIEEIYNYYI